MATLFSLKVFFMTYVLEFFHGQVGTMLGTLSSKLQQPTKFLLMAAPLEEHSNYAFRRLCHSYGADLAFTEMVYTKSIIRNNKPTLQRLDLQQPAVPTQIQLLVSNIEDLKRYLTTFSPPPGTLHLLVKLNITTGFEGFNLNMGCPSPDVIKAGLGCASIKRVSKTQQIVDVFREFGHPISIKMRLGMNSYEAEHKAYLNLISKVDADFFVVHARNGKQKYGEKADFSVYPACVDTGKIIIANGDITTPEHIEYLRSIGVRGAMLGRGACWDPSVFQELQFFLDESPTKSSPKKVSVAQIRSNFDKMVQESLGNEEYKKLCQDNILKRLGKDVKKQDANLLI